MLALVTTWLALGLLAWVYGGYVVVAWAIGRTRPLRLRDTGSLPTVTVAIAVHNEAGEIAARIGDALAQHGPGAPIVEVLIGSDGSTDDTEAIVAALAATDDRVRLLALPRAGQTATQDALFAAARGDVVILTDAETRFALGCVAALVAPFRDPRVCCTTGRLEWRDVDATATSANEGLYWRYERAVRSIESRAGLLTAVTGAVLAIRRTSFRPVPATASMDHLLPLYVREQGGSVVYVESAVAVDRPISGMREQFQNRSRTATRGIAANLSMVMRLAPWRRPGAAMAIWSHKLLRWATPWLALLAVIGSLVLVIDGRRAYAIVPISAIAGVALAAAGQAIAGSGRRPARPLAFCRAFAIVNVAFTKAWINVLRGQRIETWHRAELEQRP